MLSTLDLQRDFWQAYYAGLMKQAKDLQEQRASVMQQAAVIKRYCLDNVPETTTTANIREDNESQA